MRFTKTILLSLTVASLLQCSSPGKKESDSGSAYQRGQFGYDLNFLKERHPDLVLLSDGDAQVIVLPAYQGRVMTSTAAGAKGDSYGWINYELIDSRKFTEHMSAFGGEDRFWLGPEGGQFSIYFKKGSTFAFDNWFVPKELDTEPFSLASSSEREAKFEKTMKLKNYSETEFNLKVSRNVTLLSQDSVAAALKTDLPEGMNVVGFESENIITNTGENEWTKDSGALSIWILGMFNASDSARVAIPFRKGAENKLGKIVTDDYFGRVPSERLKIKDGFMVFKADAKYRSKIGISPARALPWLSSYDPKNSMLTIVQLTLHGPDSRYVNSEWKVQEEPFKGDAVNSYNDGPLPGGGQMGHFYELESSSPAAFLKPGESMRHVQRTFHFQGTRSQLEELSKKALQLSLNEISL